MSAAAVAPEMAAGAGAPGGAALSEGRLVRLRAAAAEAGAGAFLVRDTSNIRWACAFDGVFDDEPAHALYVCPQHAWLHTDSRYAGACEAAAAGGPVQVSVEKGSHAAFAARRWAQRPAAAAGARLGIEDAIALAEYRALQRAFAAEAAAEGAVVPAGGAAGERCEGAANRAVAPAAGAGACEAPGATAGAAGAVADASGGPFVETTDVVLRLRAVKDGDELARMAAAQAITDAAFAHIVGLMAPGMTEREVQLALDDFMLKHGAEGLAFPSIVATGPNGANPHAIPGDTVLEAGQCVVMDFGARARGYCSDMTRTVFLGRPEGEMLRAWEVLREANEAVEAFVRPGVMGRECHELAEKVLADGGFGGLMGHGLGHGVGLDVHELPTLNPRNDQPLQAGNVVTVEPGIYLPGRFGMRLEDCGVVTERGYEPFGCASHEMVVI